MLLSFALSVEKLMECEINNNKKNSKCLILKKMCLPIAVVKTKYYLTFNSLINYFKKHLFGKMFTNKKFLFNSVIDPSTLRDFNSKITNNKI